jgi:cholest-4-en-3-one 26-monooxygenase
MAGAALTLADEEPALVWEIAADEILRRSWPVLHFRRRATADVELGGVDVGRSRNGHITFGGGRPQFCLWAHLAKLDVQVAFDELPPPLGDVEPTGPVERVRSHSTNALERMPVRVTPT